MGGWSSSPSPLGLVQCNACRPPCRPALVRWTPPLPGTAAFNGLVVRVRRLPPSAPSGGSWLLRWVVRLVLVRSRQLSAVKRPFGWVLIAAVGRSPPVLFRSRLLSAAKRPFGWALVAAVGRPVRALFAARPFRGRVPTLGVVVGLGARSGTPRGIGAACSPVPLFSSFSIGLNPLSGPVASAAGLARRPFGWVRVSRVVGRPAPCPSWVFPPGSVTRTCRCH